MVGKVIKAYLADNGISQTFLSKRTGIPRNILCDRLNGKSEIKAEELYIIAQALNVPLETFRPKEG